MKAFTMAVCAKCGGRMTRRHRRWYQRFFYKQVLQCRKCKIETQTPREFTLKPAALVQCPRCHTHKVSRRIAPDKIDPVVKTFSSVVQGLLGGRLYHCNYCRIQFYDLRHSMKAATNGTVAAQAPDTQSPSVDDSAKIAS
jgi:hypothetical protein